MKRLYWSSLFLGLLVLGCSQERATPPAIKQPTKTAAAPQVPSPPVRTATAPVVSEPQVGPILRAPRPEPAARLEEQAAVDP